MNKTKIKNFMRECGFEKKIKEMFVSAVVILFFVGTFILIPNDWREESPSEFIFQYREFGRWVIRELAEDTPFIDSDSINHIEDWSYSRSLKQEINFGNLVVVTVTRADGKGDFA